MIATSKTVEFMDWTCLVEFGQYADNGRRAISLVQADTFEPIAKATVNLPGYEPPTDKHVLIKSWSENTGMIEALEKAGVVKATGRFVASGFVEAHEAVINLSTAQFMKKVNIKRG